MCVMLDRFWFGQTLMVRYSHQKKKKKKKLYKKISLWQEIGGLWKWFYDYLLAADLVLSTSRSIFNGVEFLLFMKPKCTTNSQNIPHMNLFTYGNVWSWTVALFMGSGKVENGSTGIKIRLWDAPSFSIGAENSGGFRCFHRYKSRGLSSDERQELYLENHIRTYDMKFFVFVWGTHFWILSKHFRYTVCN